MRVIFTVDASPRTLFSVMCSSMCVSHLFGWVMLHVACVCQCVCACFPMCLRVVCCAFVCECFRDAQCKLFRIVSIEFGLGLLIPLLLDLNCGSVVSLPLRLMFFPIFIFHLLLISLSSPYLHLFRLFLPLLLFPWFNVFSSLSSVLLYTSIC